MTRRVLYQLIFLAIVFASSCIETTPTPTKSGCGSVMGCCPVTGCGRGWFGSSTQRCYNTANDCSNAGNSHCRQCY
jgi:hypothetical protein